MSTWARGEKEIIMLNKQTTLKQIENLRHRLAETAYDKGFTNSETIEVSQQLDHLLNRYSNIKRMSRQQLGLREIIWKLIWLVQLFYFAFRARDLFFVLSETRLTKITAKIIAAMPTICRKLNGSEKIKMPTKVATTGSRVARMEAFDASVCASPNV